MMRTIAILGLILSCVVSSEARINWQRLTAADAAANALLGQQVAICGDHLIASAPASEGTGVGPGQAYIFVRGTNGWSQQAKLTPSDGVEDDAFGRVLAFDGNYAFLGSDNASGSIYIFQRSGTNWSFVQKLTSPSDPADGFGSSVAYSDPYLLVGADNASNASATSVGAVYTFKRNGSTWTPEVCFGSTNWQRNAMFGDAVAVQGDYAVVGAFNETNGTGHGAIYLFARSGSNWIQQARVIDPIGKLYDYFGAAVAIWSNDVVVGAPQAGYDNVTNGLAFFYHIDETTMNLIMNSMIQYPPSAGEFARSVRIGADFAVLGGDCAYVCFKNGTNWVRQIRYKVGTGERFGYSVDVSGPTVTAGAPYDSTAAAAAGAVWIYEIDPKNRQDEVRPTGENSIALFGQATATWGSLAFLGAKGGVTATSGVVYVFRNIGDRWVPQEQLYPDDRTNCTYFCAALDASDGYLVAAGPGDSRSGLAYVYNCAGGSCVRLTELSGGTAHETFGSSAAIDQGTVAIGSIDEGSSSRGAVHLYVRETENVWNLQQSIPGENFFGEFGADVELSGDTLIVGDPLSGSGDEDARGSAYIYVRQNTNWVRQALLSASDWTAGDQFGQKVALYGNYAAIHSFAGTNRAGAVYLYGREGTNWISRGKLTRPDVGPNGYFGWDLDLRGDLLLAGARLHDGIRTNSGAAWVYRRMGTNWLETVSIWAGDSGSGDSFGSAVSLGDNYAIIGAEQKTPGTAYILYGRYGFNPQPRGQILITGGNAVSLIYDDLNRFVTNTLEVSDNLLSNTWRTEMSFYPEGVSAQFERPAVSNAAFYRLISP
jgi:hypothetical protein